MTLAPSRPGARAVLLAAAWLLTVAACGGGDEPAALPSSPAAATSTPTAVVTAVPSVTASPPSATPSPRSRPLRKPAADGDVDGDAREDPLGITPSSAGNGLWTVTVRATTLGTRRGQVHAGDETPRQMGVVDADGDGFGEVFVQVTQGASTEFVAALRLVNGVLREMSLDGEPAQFGVGGSVTHGSGFACREAVASALGQELVVYDGSTEDGITWNGTITTLGWSGGGFRRLETAQETFPLGGPGGSSRQRPYYAVSCGSLGS